MLINEVYENPQELKCQSVDFWLRDIMLIKGNNMWARPRRICRRKLTEGGQWRGILWVKW